jgi:CubicO group peptidase (beta-lactamase class C family)/D-alanyl-D-alanine dipeptidase
MKSVGIAGGNLRRCRMHVVYAPKAARPSLGLALVVVLALPASAADHLDPPTAYKPVTAALERFIEHEVADKRLPALSVALVDNQRIVWARGFGHADAKATRPATAATVYRVGSVSKLFTDLGVMRLVEQGKLDLDAPVTRYLPDFKPDNAFRKPITLRQLMAHRSGLVREPPAGNYFDTSGTSLAAMVRSLNRTRLVYAPEKKIKYSNAGIAVVGCVLERTQQEPFARYLKRAVLEPLGMQQSAFEPTPAVRKDLAEALMWTYTGREFAAPTFELGMAPAGSMYSTVTDLGRFLSVLFAGGRGFVRPKTLEQMWTPQFAKPDEKEGFGIGFRLTQFEGRRRIGHGGAIYGFATELAALPGDRLGVVVVAARDGANAVTTHVADEALRLMLAARRGKPLPTIATTPPLSRELTRRLAGRYKAASKGIDLLERAGRLWLWPERGGFRTELRGLGDDLIVDDALAYGTRVRREGDKLKLGKDVYERVAVAKPPPAPPKWRGLIGEYGWDHNTLYILEKDGKLQALIEWFFLYPLKEVAKDVYQFPDWGLYQDEKLIFTRDDRGRATQVEAANVVFPRRHIDGEGGETFRIKPLRPVAELRREALTAQPPEETGDFRRSDLVDLTTLDPAIKLDIRYATTNNFLSTPLYTSAKAYMQRPAAEALLRAHRKLANGGYGLLIHDAYRPWYVTKMFWEATPEKLRVFVADPAKGSRHNRGCAVDLTLYDRKTGEPVPMVGGYDEMSDRSYPEYEGGTSRQRWHRDLLRRAMEDEGFDVYEAEWWHFDYKDWRKYRILNVPFGKIH